MDINAISQFVSTIGFPVLACLGLGWYINKITDNMQKTVEENTKAVTSLQAVVTMLWDAIKKDIDE